MKYDVIELGPRVKGNTVTFRMCLPNLDPEARVLVVGSFCDWETERALTLRYDAKSDQWKGSLEDLRDGVYEYAYLVKTGTWYSNPASDPYARMTGSNGLSAFEIPSARPARLDTFYLPKLDELILYELNLDNFNYNFEGVKNRVLYYLSNLGINGIIFSPWVGYDHKMGGEKIPLHYYAPDSSYGTPYELKVLINECHKAGIAVIMDIDLAAVSPAFGINEIYPLFENKPILGKPDESGKRVYINYGDEFAQEFVYGACRVWLEEYNVDGFRFLNTADFWDGAEGQGFSLLCKRLHGLKKSEGESIYLFAKDCRNLDTLVLNKTYINGINNSPFIKNIQRMAENRSLSGDFWKTMDLNQMGLMDENIIGEERISNTILNSIEDGDSHSLIVKMGVKSGKKDALGYPVGDRKNNWWKLKPFMISQFVSVGIPVIYNGQEMGNNKYLPEDPALRYKPSPLPWHYFGDFSGKDLYRFTQKLVLLRNKFKSIRSNNFLHYFTDSQHQVMVFKRYQDEETVIVVINFSNEGQNILVPFPETGIWQEYLDDYDFVVDAEKTVVRIPARYGGIFFKK